VRGGDRRGKRAAATPTPGELDARRACLRGVISFADDAGATRLVLERDEAGDLPESAGVLRQQGDRNRARSHPGQAAVEQRGPERQRQEQQPDPHRVHRHL